MRNSSHMSHVSSEGILKFDVCCVDIKVILKGNVWECVFIFYNKIKSHDLSTNFFPSFTNFTPCPLISWILPFHLLYSSLMCSWGICQNSPFSPLLSSHCLEFCPLWWGFLCFLWLDDFSLPSTCSNFCPSLQPQLHSCLDRHRQWRHPSALQ